ncbi:DNA ligase (NAD(+)) [Mycoplasmopsis citelli]|uniref:DNA ligase n=1 Tax=Mycoplasmopsis citelli TaxID=171281 RepID=A0A449B2M2_9BACT|nr:NAD-dependent DNA ligase LigA [Mycoplasmopsis citelli]VEU74859.1 DNA ligase (NAD(+)) [Mycoplasmopsis citelli]
MKTSTKEQANFIKKKINSLVEQINFWNYEYYDLDFPSVSDEQYDQAYQELLALETQYPEFVRKNSPTQKIGATTSNKFVKFTHQKVMLSLNKAYSIEDIVKFDTDINKVSLNEQTYSLEPKIDGLSISLHYSNGELIRAVTRGDGVTGEIVTENIKQIKNIPLQIDYLNDLEIRGEVYLSKQNYNKANEKIINETEFIDALKNLKNIVNNHLENSLFIDHLQEFKDLLLEGEQLKTSSLNNQKLLNEYTQKVQAFFKEKNILSFEYQKSEPKLFANPRNAASGTLRQLDLTIVKERNLDYFVYEIVSPELHNINTQIDALMFLKKHGFVINEYIKNVKNIEEVIQKIQEFKNIKPNLPYDCDGFVIKVNQMKFWEPLGFTSKFPKYAIAFKYETEEAITKILDISAEVGRTGKITYLAKLAPVQLNQTTVQSATLHNYEYIHNMNLNIGDLVKVIKSGEIIPKVIALVQKNTPEVFPKILKCPSCDSELVETEELVDQMCENSKCNEKIIRSIVHFASRDALNIMDLGEENIRLFYKENLLKNILDIFQLHNQKEQLEALPKIGKKKVLKIIASIEKAKNTTVAKALFAIGIKTIGAQVAELIAEKIEQLSDLIAMDLEELTLINTIGNVIVDNLKIFINQAENQVLLKTLDNLFNYQKITKGTKLQGFTFVITGTLSKSRDHYKNLLISNGAKVASSVSSQTTYLLAGENAGSKLQKAQDLNVKILTEEQLNNILK